MSAWTAWQNGNKKTNYKAFTFNEQLTHTAPYSKQEGRSREEKQRTESRYWLCSSFNKKKDNTKVNTFSKNK